MALIHEITGSLLLNLAGTDTSSARSSGSSVGGQGSRASFDNDPVSLGAGLSKASSIFASSLVRLDDAIEDVGRAKEALNKLSTISSRMLDLAQTAADAQTSDADRTRYNSKFKTLVVEFNAAKQLAEHEDEDFLEMSDLRDQLKESGIELDAPTELAAVFSRAGGADDELGYEKFTRADGSQVNPLTSSLASYEDATAALEGLEHLDKHVRADFSSIELVQDELKDARAFAFYGFSAFNDAANGRIRETDPEALAGEIQSKIRQQASDPMLSAHSNLDSKLAQDLLEYTPENSFL
jgi:hypothetical protein